jgi:hypothetical protein
MSDQNKIERQALDAVAELLKSKGWRVAVIGGARVEQRDPSRQFHFEFVVGFTGSKSTAGRRALNQGGEDG